MGPRLWSLARSFESGIMPSMLVRLLTIAALAVGVSGPAGAPDVAADAARSADASPAKGVFPYPMHVSKLPNGLTLVVVPMDSGGLVAYRTAVRTGARDEYERGHTGFAHFFEHMMFRGTERFPAEVYGRIVTELGADANAYTSADLTVYQLDIAAEDLERVMEIESDRFMNLSYSEEAFKTEAGAVYGEYRKSRASPGYWLYEKLLRVAFKRHTYAHMTIGFEADIKAMPTMYGYSKLFFSRYYRPENCVVIVAGDVEPAAVKAGVERYYGAWEPGYVAPKVKPEPAQQRERRARVKYPGKTLPRLVVGYKAGAADPDDRAWAASLVLARLAFGQTSDVYRQLRLEQRVVQSIGASPSRGRDPGLWSISATVKRGEDIERVLAEIDKTVARFRDAPPAPDALAAVTSNMKYGFLMDLDTPSAVAGRLARIAAITGAPDAYDRMYAQLERVTPADVQRAAEAIFNDKRRTVVILEGE